MNLQGVTLCQPKGTTYGQSEGATDYTTQKTSSYSKVFRFISYPSNYCDTSKMDI